MTTIYAAVYICKDITPIGLPGYNKVTLGLPYGNAVSNIVIQGTLSRFVVGNEYGIFITEK